LTSLINIPSFIIAVLSFSNENIKLHPISFLISYLFALELEAV